MGFEEKIIVFLQSGASEGWTAFFKAISLFGSFVGFLIVFGTFFLINKKYAITYLITYLLGVSLNYIIKSIVSRDRPYVTYQNIQGLTDALGSSMPSGHAVSSVITAIFVCFFVYKIARKKFTKIATIATMSLFVCTVCLSRMYLGVHYLTDLIVGLCLGTIIAIIGVCVFKKPRKKEES